MADTPGDQPAIGRRNFLKGAPRHSQARKREPCRAAESSLGPHDQMPSGYPRACDCESADLHLTASARLEE